MQATQSNEPGATGPAPRGTGFRLVDQHQAHLKFANREPRTLHELAVARTNYEHERRIAELGAMAKKLSLLDEHLPALAEHGITFSRRDISTTDGGKTLRILPEVFSLRDDKLYAALIALGFREVDRSSYRKDAEFEQVTLKHGRALLVKIDVTKRGEQ